MTTNPRCVPGPVNTATIRWRDPAADKQRRLHADVYPHETGGLTELSDDDGKGLAVCILNDTGTTEPAPNQTAGIARTPNGKLYAPLPQRKRRTIPAVTRPNVSASQQLLSNDSIELNNEAGDQPACWEVCVDICDGFIDNPVTAAPTVTIPPDTTTINTSPDGGTVDVTHSHGQITVTHADPPQVTMALTVNGDSCNYMRNDSTGFGRICHYVQVPAGVTLNLPISADLTVEGAHEPFAASTGSLTVTWTPTTCAEEC